MSEIAEVKSQRDASVSECKLWKSMGCFVLLGKEPLVCILNSLLPVLIDYLYSCTHPGKEEMIQQFLKRLSGIQI